MAKDVLKLHGCRWNAKDSSKARDSRTDCGAQLACFANLEKVRWLLRSYSCICTNLGSFL